MKKILFFLTISIIAHTTLAQKHHEYNASKLDIYYLQDISKNDYTEIKLAEQNNSFWTEDYNSAVRELVNRQIKPQNAGGDLRLQEIVRGILSITDKNVEVYIYNDLRSIEAQNRNGSRALPRHPIWSTYAFCPDGDDPTKSWPCAFSINNQSQAGVIGIGNYAFNVASTDKINKFHDQLYLYETYVHELTHTQFTSPNENTLGNIPFYGDDNTHYLFEMIPSKNAAFGEAIANAFAMRYHKSSTWWTKSASAPQNSKSPRSTPPKKPLPSTPSENNFVEGQPDTQAPTPPARNNKTSSAPNKPLPTPPIGNNSTSSPPNKPVPVIPKEQSERRNETYKENYDVITWLNNDYPLIADVNLACGQPENANSKHCLVNRLKSQNITGTRYNPGKVPALAYSIHVIPPDILLHNEMVQTNIFADFMTVFKSTSIMTQSVKMALAKINPNAPTIPNSMFGLVFKEMVRSASTHKNMTNTSHDGKYMPIAILDFYTGFKLNSKQDLERAIGETWTRADVNIDTYFEKLRPQLIQYWNANNNYWDRSILIKFSKDLKLNPNVAFGVRAGSRK